MNGNRIRQFFRAIAAKLDSDDVTFVQEVLSIPEQKLFFAMSIPDQYHALHTARSALELLEVESSENVRRGLLLRCALLHDVGRVYGDMGTFSKIFAVCMDRFLRNGAISWSKYGKTTFWTYPRHVLYIYYNHPKIGAQKLLSLGLNEEAAIIVRHHMSFQESDVLELRILRQADNMN